MLTHFADSEGTLYDTSDDHETLITRPRDLQDNARPSGNAMAVTALLKLAGFTNQLRYVDLTHLVRLRVKLNEPAPALTVYQVRLLLVSVLPKPVFDASAALRLVRYYQKRNHIERQSCSS